MTLNEVMPYADQRREALYQLIQDLTQDELDQTFGYEKRTIGEILRHCFHSERWLIKSAIHGEDVPHPDADRVSGIPEILFALKKARNETNAFLAPLTVADLDTAYPWDGKGGLKPPMNPFPLRWLLSYMEDRNSQRTGQVVLLKRMVREKAGCPCKE